jgi:hypothetical protein
MSSEAAECLGAARQVANDRQRAKLMAMAQAWIMLADQAERNSPKDPVYETAAPQPDRHVQWATRGCLVGRSNVAEEPVNSILPFIDRSVFDPEAVHAMSVAFDDLCRAFELTEEDRVREIMASRIVELARLGERDADRLRDRIMRETGSGRGL